jgi:hypothetical protein
MSTTAQDIDHAIKVVGEVVRQLQPRAAQATPILLPDKDEYRLTLHTHGLGCACKLRPHENSGFFDPPLT